MVDVVVDVVDVVVDDDVESWWWRRRPGGHDDVDRASPGGTLAPGRGFETTTMPGCVLGRGDWRDVARPPSPALARGLPGDHLSRPTSEGTMALAGPEDTVKVTAEPWLTLVPDVGFVLSTVPFCADSPVDDGGRQSCALEDRRGV